MTIEQIIELTKAGFTKDDIFAMSRQSQQMPVQTQQMPVQAQTQQMPAQQMPAQTQQMLNGYYAYSGYPQNINQNSQQNDVLDALKNLTRTVQSNNVNMMQNQIPKQVTTEDAIASIINPPNYEGLTDGGNK